MGVVDCEHCRSNNPYRYQWDNPCCRVRFLVGQPSKEARAGWLDRWAKNGEGQMVDAVKEELKRIWEAKR